MTCELFIFVIGFFAVGRVILTVDAEEAKQEFHASDSESLS